VIKEQGAAKGSGFIVRMGGDAEQFAHKLAGESFYR
jgi:cold shock CspA family protein